MSTDDTKVAANHAIETPAKHATKASKSFIPTVNEIHDLNQRADREKKKNVAGSTALSTTKARQGVVVGGMRYVLAISLVLVILGMILAYILTLH
jgi:hypothetical protein